MLKRNFFQILILFVITGFLVSCATTTETFILKDKEYNGGKFDSILIIGIAENVENRILFENTFAETFQKLGFELNRLAPEKLAIRAVPSLLKDSNVETTA